MIINVTQQKVITGLLILLLLAIDIKGAYIWFIQQRSPETALEFISCVILAFSMLILAVVIIASVLLWLKKVYTGETKLFNPFKIKL